MGRLVLEPAGYVTKYPINVTYDLGSTKGFEALVEVVELDEVSEMVFLVSNQKITDRDPVNATDWYMINKVFNTKYPHQNLTRVVSRIDGNISWLVEVPWVAPTGELKIRISNGSISFYENGLLRYSELYSINSRECYIYVYTSKWGHYSGTDCFDNFAIYPLVIDEDIESFSSSLSISTESLSTVTGSVVNIFGRLTNFDNIPLQNKNVVLSYKFEGIDYWIPISSAPTNEKGEYKIQWINSASGTFTLKTEWTGDITHPRISNTTTLSFVPNQNQQVFLIESNITITSITFINETSLLSFNVTGQSGTIGFVKANIAKSLLANEESLQVYLDGNKINYSVYSEIDSWVFMFTYSHSTHKINIHLSQNLCLENYDIGILFIIIFALGAVLAIEIKYLLKTKRPVITMS